MKTISGARFVSLGVIALAVGACAGGGGGTAAPITITSSTSNQPSEISVGSASSSSISGSQTNNDAANAGSGGAVTGGATGTNSSISLAVTPASRATVSSNSTAVPIAIGLTPNFSAFSTFAGSNTWPNLNSAFPLLQSALTITPTSVAPDTATNTGGATLTYAQNTDTTITYTGLIQYHATANGFSLNIPSLGINSAATAPGEIGHFGNSLNNQTTYALDPFLYAIPGIWSASGNGAATVAAFTTGFQTPGGAIAATGSAIFRGDSFALLFAPNSVATVQGTASLTANFGTASLTGLFANMVATDALASASGAFNDVNLSARIDGASSAFSGTTSAGSSPSSSFALAATASGNVDGRFYGPNGQEVGAVWTLNDGKSTALGFVAASSAPAPVIETPALPSMGSLAMPTVYASGASTPVFDGSTNVAYALAKPFAAIATTMRFTSAGASPLLSLGNNTSGATLTVISAEPDWTISLDINGVEIGGIMAPNVHGWTESTGALTDAFIYNLSYVSLGLWSHTDGGPFQLPQSLTAFAIGWETPAAALPTSGTATYSGTGSVRGVAFVPDGARVGTAQLAGDGSLNVNFSSGAISGALTNMTANDGRTTTPWNDVSVNASVATGTNRFSGSTQVSSPPAGGYALKGSATGSISGALYGPNAENLGAVWTLSNGDGTGSAIGVVGATKH